MKKIVQEKTYNSICILAFIFGIISVFVGIYIFPLLSIILGIIGISTFNNKTKKGKWMGIVGLILGIVYFLVYIVNYFQYY